MSTVTTFVRHMVSDYDTWREHYDAFQDTEAAEEIKSGTVFRSVDDPRDVTVVHEFDNITDAKALLESPALQAAMEAAGVEGTPLIWFTEEDD
jgi:quinol monooxygenase YgiN